MPKNMKSGAYGIYYNFYNTSTDKSQFPDGPELMLYLRDKGDVYGSNDSINIPGKHLAAFCTELIKMARELGVTGEKEEESNG